MNPWITGRIIETMQQEARNRGAEARLGLEARRHPVDRPIDVEPRDPRRERLGLAVARVGLRIAGRTDQPIATTRPTSYRSNPWTTCGATSTSSR
jgi:hypothetical protein